MWQLIKEITGKIKIKTDNLPRRIIINNQNIYNKKQIANQFNNFFTNIGPNLASKISTASKCFKSYLKSINSVFECGPLTSKEFEEAFFSLKTNKSAGYDDISFNIIKKAYTHLYLMYFSYHYHRVFPQIV